ncbi:MAG TPA: FecR domain-containing protein [Alphaproteobacteria bacterium]|nr:FecR domain-containing protein [Alphaproteobacteria bacterium]
MQRVVIALLSISLPLAFAALPGHAEAPPKVGVVTAVNPETTGSTAASAVRVIDLGNDVVFDEKIATGEAGQAQVFFLDQSSLSIGPRSEITIDRFVYDPDRHAGALAIKIGEGLARYVGGRISKESDVTFTTPTATVGIRGGIALIEVAPGGATRATFLFGEHMTVTSGGKSRTVLRPGYSVSVDAPGAAPSPPVKTTLAEIEKVNRALEKLPAMAAAKKDSTIATPKPSPAPRATPAVAAEETAIEKTLDAKAARLEHDLIATPDDDERDRIDRIAKLKQHLRRRLRRTGQSI